MTEYIDNPMPPSVAGALHSLDSGAKFPYDADDAWRDAPVYDENPGRSWSIAAARGIVANLTDRRDIKQGFDNVDEDVRVEIVETIATIIENAPSWYLKQTAPLEDDDDDWPDDAQAIELKLTVKGKAYEQMLTILTAALSFVAAKTAAALVAYNKENYE